MRNIFTIILFLVLFFFIEVFQIDFDANLYQYVLFHFIVDGSFALIMAYSKFSLWIYGTIIYLYSLYRYCRTIYIHHIFSTQRHQPFLHYY